MVRKTHRQSAAMLLLACLMAAVAILDATPAHASGVLRVVTNEHSNLCLDVAYGSTERGARIQQYTCYGGRPEKWWYEYVPERGAFRIRNDWSNMCLDVPNGYVNWGVELHQWDCWEGTMQLWVIVQEGDDRQSIRPYNDTTFCLDDKDWNTTPGATIQLWKCNGYAVQKWRHWPQ